MKLFRAQSRIWDGAGLGSQDAACSQAATKSGEVAQVASQPVLNRLVVIGGLSGEI